MPVLPLLPLLTGGLFVLFLVIAKRQLTHNITASRISWQNSYDFVIVGAGSAGSTVARRLAETQNATVLLLEAGGATSAIYNDIPAMAFNIKAKRPDLQWVYYNEPQINFGEQYPGNVIPETTGKSIGGSSSHNYMLFNRGNRRGYEWDQMFGANGWSFEELLPYFKRFENNTDPKILEDNPQYHGTNGPIQVRSAQNVPKFIKLCEKAFNDLGFNLKDFSY